VKRNALIGYQGLMIMSLEQDNPEPKYKRKADHSGVLAQTWQKTKEALGSPKFEAPDDPYYACPYYTEIHWVDYDEKSGYWYCMDHDAEWTGPRWYFRLDELWRTYNLEEKAEYVEGIPKPLRRNQKITDGDLEYYFDELDGDYVKVSVLKDIFGPSPERPDGLIKVNVTDTSTTVISSSYLRRLKRITGRKWGQERAVGENGEMLVRFYSVGPALPVDEFQEEEEEGIG